MIILYGSQTGNSIHIAKLIQNVILYGYNKDLIYNVDKELLPTDFTLDMDSFDFEKILDIDMIIFVCSTHGNGSEPFNMTKFWKFLRKKNLPTNFLQHLNFAVFGLGDSSYKSFNFCSKKLYNCLLKHGAKPLIRKGNGDSQDKEGFMGEFKTWIKDLYYILPHYKLQNAKNFASCKNDLYSASINDIKILTPYNYIYPILEIKFDIDIENFEIGDCLAVYPENYNYEEFVRYNNIKDNTLVKYIKKYCDFNSIPQIYFFLQLSLITDTIAEEYREKCKEIYLNYDLYYDYILLPKRTIFEVLKDFKIKLTSNFMYKYIPVINPRYFTLTKKDFCYFVTISLVSFKTSLKEERKGLCSEYLKLLTKGSTIHVNIVQNRLNFSGKKILFMCTGTGITLPRAFVNYYSDLNFFKKVILLYGFRFRDVDFLYKEEFENKGIEIYPAVSREDNKYIQDIYKTIKGLENIDDWLIFVSGNSRLNNIIEKMLLDIYKKKIYFQAETW